VEKRHDGLLNDIWSEIIWNVAERYQMKISKGFFAGKWSEEMSAEEIDDDRKIRLTVFGIPFE
jgi:hypothetical protein